MPEPYYTFDKWGALVVDLKGLLASGRYDRQLKAAANMKEQNTGDPYDWNEVVADDIKLYPMTQDVLGQRTHQEYVDQTARFIIHELIIDRRIDFYSLKQLVNYAEQNQDRL